MARCDRLKLHARVSGLPEFMPEAELQRRFGSLRSPGCEKVIARIDRRDAAAAQAAADRAAEPQIHQAALDTVAAGHGQHSLKGSIPMAAATREQCRAGTTGSEGDAAVAETTSWHN